MKLVILKKAVVGVALALVATGAVYCYWLFRPLPRTDLSRFVPDDALAFVEFGDLPSVFQDLRTTEFWEKTRPAIGFPDQLLYIGESAGLVRQLDLGPDEAVILSRAQWAIAITGFSAEGNSAGMDNGVELSVTPRCTLIMNPRTSLSRAERSIQARLPALARKIFGADVITEVSALRGTSVLRFRKPGLTRTLLVAIRKEAVFFSNDEDSLQSCFDAQDARRSSLSSSDALVRGRQIVQGEGATVFAYVSPSGLSKLAQFGLGVLPDTVAGAVSVNDGRERSLPDAAMMSVTNGLVYSARIENKRVTDRYHILLRPELVEQLRAHCITDNGSLHVMDVLPVNVTSYATLSVRRPVDLVEKVQAAISSRTNVAVAFFLREFNNAMRQRYGLGPRDTLDDVLGEEVVMASLNRQSSNVWLFEVRDRVRILPVLDRYLRAKKFTLMNEIYRGADLVVSTHPDNRAACFIGDFLVVGTKEQLRIFVDAKAEGATFAQSPNSPFRIPTSGDQSFVHTMHSDREELESLALAIAKLAHAGDATRERLRDPAVRQALDAQPMALGKTELRADGIYMETRSAAGNFARLASFVGEESPIVSPPNVPKKLSGRATAHGDTVSQ